MEDGVVPAHGALQKDGGGGGQLQPGQELEGAAALEAVGGGKVGVQDGEGVCLELGRGAEENGEEEEEDDFDPRPDPVNAGVGSEADLNDAAPLFVSGAFCKEDTR